MCNIKSEKFHRMKENNSISPKKNTQQICMGRPFYNWDPADGLSWLYYLKTPSEKPQKQKRKDI